jgi:hypothetical protein
MKQPVVENNQLKYQNLKYYALGTQNQRKINKLPFYSPTFAETLFALHVQQQQLV